MNNADPANPVIHRRINVSTTAGEADVGTPNSVSIYDGYAAVSLDGVPYTADGVVRIYHLASGVWAAWGWLGLHCCGTAGGVHAGSCCSRLHQTAAQRVWFITQMPQYLIGRQTAGRQRAGVSWA